MWRCCTRLAFLFANRITGQSGLSSDWLISRYSATTSSLVVMLPISIPCPIIRPGIQSSKWNVLNWWVFISVHWVRCNPRRIYTLFSLPFSTLPYLRLKVFDYNFFNWHVIVHTYDYIYPYGHNLESFRIIHISSPFLLWLSGKFFYDCLLPQLTVAAWISVCFWSSPIQYMNHARNVALFDNDEPSWSLFTGKKYMSFQSLSFPALYAKQVMGGMYMPDPERSTEFFQ